MKNKWYQIDKYIGEIKGEFFEGYEMVQATSLDNALKKFFGVDYPDMIVEKEKQDGRTLISCPKETTVKWAARKVK